MYTGANPSAGTDQGLAEYTNANFFSEDTVFAAERYGEHHVHYSPFPKISSLPYEDFFNDELLPDRIWSEDGEWDFRLYIPKHGGHGEAVDHFLAVGYFSIYGKQDPYLYRSFFLDERCHRSYAQKLVPRAVGYSAALLDYFFRGRLSTANPVVRYGPGFTISGLRFDARNATRPAEGLPVERMEAGKLDLVCRYFDPAAGQWQGSVATDVYALSGPDDPINSGFVGLSADFPEPIPFGAREISFMLVFSGKLGHEAGAVIGARIDTLVPSRIAFEHQPGGAPNASDIHIVLPDGSDDRIVTASDGISRWYYSPAWSPVGEGATLAYEFESCGVCDGSDGKRRITLHDLWWGNAPLLLSDFVTVDQPPADYCGEAWGSVMAAPSFSADGTRMSAVNWVAAGTLDAVATIGIETDTSWHWIKDYELWRQKAVTGSTPEWSPTRDEIAFCIVDRFNPAAGGRAVENDIYVIDADSGGLLRLTRDSDLNAHPSWSPDGEWLVFVSDRDGEGPLDIWVMDRSGNEALKILDCDSDCWHPVFSPDGLRMAFVQDDSIHVMRIFEQNPVRVTHYGYRTAAPDWSPALAPPEVFLEASAGTVTPGEVVTLTWHSNDADSANIGGIGDVDLSGTLEVVPDATTIYTITVLGLGGYAQAGATIFVNAE